MYIERPDWTTKNISIGNYSIYHRLECVEHSKFTYDTIYCILNNGPWNRTQRIIINDLYWRNFVIIRKKISRLKTYSYVNSYIFIFYSETSIRGVLLATGEYVMIVIFVFFPN